MGIRSDVTFSHKRLGMCVAFYEIGFAAEPKVQEATCADAFGSSRRSFPTKRAVDSPPRPVRAFAISTKVPRYRQMRPE
jgi:hypothetical protein